MKGVKHEIAAHDGRRQRRSGSNAKAQQHVEIVADARLPTRYGLFRVFAFCNDIDGREHVALVRGNAKQKRIPLRVHSECLTGDVLGSLRCDCRAQLEAALRMLGERKRGVLLYMRQEGRGIGLANKIRAYRLQDMGLDTVEANKRLGFAGDARDYYVAARMIRALGIKSVLLITNNPAKLSELRRHCIAVAGRIPLETKPTRHDEGYLRTKKEKLGHLLENV